MGLHVRTVLVEVNDYRCGLAAASSLSGVDGVFCINDYMAFGVMDGLRRMTIPVPEQIRIIGHDDVPQASWVAYDLTTIIQPSGLQAEQAIDLLVSRMGDVSTPERVSVTPVSLVRRHTA
jgi:LacI family transcriptional regulator